VPRETFTHSHLSRSSITLYLLLPSIAIHGILSVQFTCLTVFLHNTCPSFLWSTSLSDSGTLHLILHTFLHPIIVFFSQHNQYHRKFATCFTVVPRLYHPILLTVSTLHLVHNDLHLKTVTVTINCSYNCFCTCVYRHDFRY